MVFGATGTIGTYLISDLLAQQFQVIAVGHRLLDNGYFASIHVPYYAVDITQKEDFNRLPNDDIYAVVHLAGAIPARMRGYEPQTYIDTIMTGTLNVLNYCQQVHADRIIFAQSISDVMYLYGSVQPIPSDSEIRFPLNNDHSVYSICKTGAVHLIQHYQAKYGIKGFILRFPNIYLYHPNPYYFVDGVERWQGYRLLIDKAKRGEPIEMWGNPNRVRDIVYVKDCDSVIIGALQSVVAGGIYNVGTGIGISLREQIEGIVAVFSPKHHRSPIIERPEMPDAPEYVMDISKTIKELGYQPQFDYLSYLKDMKLEMEQNRFQLLWGKDLIH